jgi:hypothetical protein
LGPADGNGAIVRPGQPRLVDLRPQWTANSTCRNRCRLLWGTKCQESARPAVASPAS